MGAQRGPKPCGKRSASAQRRLKSLCKLPVRAQRGLKVSSGQFEPSWPLDRWLRKGAQENPWPLGRWSSDLGLQGSQSSHRSTSRNRSTDLMYKGEGCGQTVGALIRPLCILLQSSWGFPSTYSRYGWEWARIFFPFKVSKCPSKTPNQEGLRKFCSIWASTPFKFAGTGLLLANRQVDGPSTLHGPADLGVLLRHV